MSDSCDSGLSSKEALDILTAEANTALESWKNSLKPRVRRNFLLCHANRFARHFCGVYQFYLLICSILMVVGAVDLDNELSYSLLSVAILILLFVVLLYFLQTFEKEADSNHKLHKAEEVISYIKKLNGSLAYSTMIEPLTEDMWGQLCLRDGQPVNVPKMMLVKGDTILLRPGQVAPCACTTSDGVVLKKGSKLPRTVVIECSTDTTEQLTPIKARLDESPITQHLHSALSMEPEPSILDKQIKFVVHVICEKVILPISLVGVTVAVVIRYLFSTSDSLFGTRFVFSTGPLILLPILCPTLPIILAVIWKWNNHVICEELDVLTPNILCVFPKDFLVLLGSLTGVSVVDKKGLLSPMNPSLDKVIVFRDGAIAGDVEPDVMDLSSELLQNGKWGLYFDDPAWRELEPNLRPVALNLQLNSCRHNLPYFAFLDHLSCVSDTVPRTIVTANRRCMCLFPPLLGFNPSSTKQFHSADCHKLIGFYKRQPGDAPVPGLTKHRTPLEMAFCSVHPDDRSIHSHVSCQGTANIVLEASSHVWNGNQLVPLSARLAHVVRDLYHRFSMTGYCLALSYRATGYSIHDDVTKKYIEVPLTGPVQSTVGSLPRSHSFDELLREEFFSQKVLTKADDVIENLFTGHVLCGMAVMQYEALPAAVQLVDRLENNCIRFVYFSRENELRSRVFAEKLGLEAGWNCHVSLAEEQEGEGGTRVRDAKQIFKSRVPRQYNQWAETPRIRRKRNSQLCRSELLLSASGFDVLSKVSPFRRRSDSSGPEKVGPMPNKAQLPTGVRAVRPHLEEVDNVPLLVGLFTDCSPAANADMVEIMQEYGEVVLSIGSSLNTANIDIFVQSDISVCVTPPLASNCHSTPAPPLPQITANHLAGRIMAIATDFELDHKRLLLLPDLITACRHRLASIRYALFFLFLSSSLVSLTLFLTTALFLPIIFTTGQVMLLVFFQLPLLVGGVVWIPFHPDESFIRIAAKNSSYFNRSAVTSSLSTFVVQFIPTSLVLIATFFFSLTSNSTLLCSFSDVVCSLSEDVNINLSTDQIRHVVGFHLNVYLCVSSVSWVYPLSSFWSRIPVTSSPWIGSVVTCLASQVIFSYLSGVYLHSLVSIPSWIVMIVWTTVLLLTNELCKFRRIRQFQREQRRTKLAFDTKLGMNSPY